MFQIQLKIIYLIYTILMKKIKVIYHGADHLDNIKPLDFNIKFDKEFLLYIGERSKYKKFNFLLEAFSKLGKIKKSKSSLFWWR